MASTPIANAPARGRASDNGSRHIQAEHEHQERIGLPVQPGAEPGHGPRQPRDPPVDRVQQQRNGGDPHDCALGSHRPGVDERVSDKCRDTAAQGRSGERDQVGRSERRHSPAGCTTCRRDAQHEPARESRRPPQEACSGGRLEHCEQHDQAGQARRQTAANLDHRASHIVALRTLSGDTRVASVRFTGALWRRDDDRTCSGRIRLAGVARAGRRRRSLDRARGAASATPADRWHGGPRPRLRHRFDGALARPAAERTSAVGAARPGRRAARACGHRPSGPDRRRRRSHPRDPARRHHPVGSG